jgi:DNA (cytosine-5)-methyltransferase 1
LFRYQVRFKLLQAAQYGVPQSRRRVIFWGAKRGLALPNFPVPVHAYPQGMNRVSLPTGKILSPPTRCKEPDGFHSYAPLPAITVNTALGDLVRTTGSSLLYSIEHCSRILLFSFSSSHRLIGMVFGLIRALYLTSIYRKNPHQYISATKQDRKATKKREEELGIPAMDAVLENFDGEFSSLPGYPDGAPYPMEPQNRFQSWLRRGLEEDDEVTGHYTRRMGARPVEA